jgi:type IV secretion system protein VirB11
MAEGVSSLSEVEQERRQSAESAVRHLRKYLDLPHVQEVAVNDPGRVWLGNGGVWTEQLDEEITFKYLDYLSRNLSELAKKPFIETKPCIDLEMHTGERFHAKRPPTSPQGHLYINIRKHVTDAYPFDHYAKQGYFETTRHDFAYKITEAEREQIRPHLAADEITLWNYAQAGKWAEFFQLAVSSYQNIVISGATGSGKTTFARSLMELTDPKSVTRQSLMRESCRCPITPTARTSCSSTVIWLRIPLTVKKSNVQA